MSDNESFLESLENELEFQMGTDEWSTLVWISIITQCVPLVFSFIGILGAQFFVPWMVIVAASWYSFAAVVYLVFFGFVPALMPGAFAYPHIVLANEMIRGVITEKNYPNKSFCCCQV